MPFLPVVGNYSLFLYRTTTKLCRKTTLMTSNEFLAKKWIGGSKKRSPPLYSVFWSKLTVTKNSSNDEEVYRIKFGIICDSYYSRIKYLNKISAGSAEISIHHKNDFIQHLLNSTIIEFRFAESASFSLF